MTFIELNAPTANTKTTKITKSTKAGGSRCGWPGLRPEGRSLEVNRAQRGRASLWFTAKLLTDRLARDDPGLVDGLARRDSFFFVPFVFFVFFVLAVGTFGATAKNAAMAAC